MEDYQEKQHEFLHSLLSRSYEIEGADFSPQQFEENVLIDEEDRLCVMHRDAHFGSNFDEMIRYYKEEKKGAVLDIPVKRIEALKEKEKQLGANIAPLLLSGSDAEKVQMAKKLYHDLRTLFEKSDQHNIVYEIASLILSEDEYEEEAKAILSLGKSVIPYLLEIIQSSAFKDPLFPGYGKAPLAAAYALGMLKAEEAIIPLFELLCENPEEYEEVAISALLAIGPKAQEFLMRQACKKPITHINEQAVSVLLSFGEGQKIADLFFSMLQDKDIIKKTPFACYLALGCTRLEKSKQAAFVALIDNPDTPFVVKEEIKLVSNNWDKK